MAEASAAIAADDSMEMQADHGLQIQPTGFFLELSPDWLILRASENVHRFLGEYHSRLIGEHLSKYTLAQPLHDLRNTLTRQRSSLGIARAYRVRLIDEPKHFDFAFQQGGGRILLEGVPSAEEGFGVWMGSISRLLDGLDWGEDLETGLENAARRLRALGGFDRVVAALEDGRLIESNRGTIDKERRPGTRPDCPAIIADSSAQPVPAFPRRGADQDGIRPLMHSPSLEVLQRLRERHVGSSIRLPIVVDGEAIGEFRCESRDPRPPQLELHAAAELFVQILAPRLSGR